MTKAFGIDIGSSFIHLVELDGSARRFKVSRMLSLPRQLPTESLTGEEDAEPRSEHLSKELARALESFEAARQRCVLSVSGASCVLRNFVLPFRGRDEIRKVLKFESEGQIHSHSIDDVVVDAAVVSEDDDGTELFMAAHPKALLAPQLRLLAKHGVSPEKADLDCALLHQAAMHFGLVDEAAGDELDLIVDIGQSSVQLVLIRGSQLATARVLRWGLDKLESDLAESLGCDSSTVHDAVHRFFELPVADDFAEAGEHIEEAEGELVEELVHETPSVGINVHEDELRAGGKRFVARIAREIYRFLAGMPRTGNLRQVLLSGGGARLPGIDQQLADELQVEVSLLDLLARVSGEEESDPGYDTALAAAMLALGSTKATMNFRQEELAFRRKFDKLKLPIMAFVWLLLCYVVFTCYNLTVERNHLDWAVGVPRASDSNRKFRTPRYTGLLESLTWPTRDQGYVLRDVSDSRDAWRILEAVAKEDRPGKRVSTLRSRLRNLKKKLETDTGYFPEVKLESGLAVLQSFAEVIEEADASPSIGRFVVTEIDLQVGGQGKSPGRLSFTIGFRGSDFRIQSANFQSICQQAVKKGGPFQAFREAKGEQLYSDIDGAAFQLQFDIKNPYGVFQPTEF
ncbi:MAG: hypothetical protein CSA62_01855 [Planctomycetota bacterium]|nr:MAG: hypothetical protein CSA62_01855 [Planctomycetota bacterium]